MKKKLAYINAGNDILGMAITNRMSIIRKKAAALGLTPAVGGPVTAKPASRAPNAAKSQQKRKDGGKLRNGSE